MNVRETPSNITTTTASASLAANVDRKKLKITNVSGATIQVNFSGTTPGASTYDEAVGAGATITIENYVGACTASASVRYVEFT